NLAERRSQWLRCCWDWRPTGQSLRLEFRSLAIHLLGLYPVPGFMDSVWDLPSGPEAFRQQAWFIRLARGASFRELNLPLPLTRRMEHHVRQAPDHYTVSQALRYGEVLGLGEANNLARACSKSAGVRPSSGAATFELAVISMENATRQTEPSVAAP